MQIVRTIAALREAIQAGPRPAFVPTMGNLHQGHLALVRQARAAVGESTPVVASIFVNRLQFGPHEDFDSYPRTFERDCALLQDNGCDLVFAPDEAELYPEPQTVKVHPPAALADVLEGAFRPGFFVGVSTVVLKLFNAVQPGVAVFGKKDMQQLLVIRHMVRQLALPVQVLAGETARADDGLALSSRNIYLSAEERVQAPALAQTLRHLAAAVQGGRRDFDVLQAEALAALQTQGWAPDYVALRRQADLALPQPGAEEPLVVLAAARLGRTRLIDSLELGMPSSRGF